MTSLFMAATVVCVVSILGLELTIRALGIHDFPLFARDPASVYRMASSQRGRFRRRYSWCYNKFGMRHAEEPRDLAEAVVILGDSVVDGGNHLDQRQTLAALVSMEIHEKVYPVACHGWAVMNELGALTALPGWQHIKHLVWFINTGDLDTVGEGESELSFPTKRPIWLLFWLARRHIYRRNPRWWPWRRAEMNSAPRPDIRVKAIDRIRDVAEQIYGSITIVCYPTRDEKNCTDQFFRDIGSLRKNIKILSASDISEWSAECYIDNIHPNAHGVELLSKFVIDILKNNS